MTASMRIWSVGHSTHDMQRFLELLQGTGIEVVADVRSQPYSRFNSQFNRRDLCVALRQAGLDYVFLGDELGGRPPEEHLYDAEGHVLYGEVAKTARFREGFDRLVDGAKKFRVTTLCSEEDPTDCHRRLLITRVLCERGVTVTHIRGDGTTVTEEDLRARSGPEAQTTLFGEEPAWRSTRSVSRNTALKSSLRS